MRLPLAFVLALTVVGVTLGCTSKPKDKPVIPAVKTAKVHATAGSFSRAISGVVEAQNTTSLSFPVGGTVAKVLVEAGEQVKAGQVLASLDPQPFDMRLRAAEARVRSVQASLLKSKDQHQRKSTLLSQGFIARAEFDETKASLAASRGELDVALSELESARRDRARTVITAPYAGVIGRKDVQPHQEAPAGKAVFDILGEGGMKVRVNVPESLIGGVKPGDEAQAAFSVLRGVTAIGRVAEVSAVAESGNAYPVTIALDTPPAGLRIGMTALVSFHSGGSAPIFLLPMTALAINEVPRLAAGGGTDGKAPIFIFDGEKQAVVLRLVEVQDMQGNSLAVTRGLSDGEEVVVAGAAFLRDGMTVRRWTPDVPPEEMAIGSAVSAKGQ